MIGPSLAALPQNADLPIEQEIYSATFTHCGRSERTRRSSERILSLVSRQDFDAFLLAEAERAGAQVCTQTQLISLTDDGDSVQLRTSKGNFRGGFVIGADGSASRVARYVGVSMSRVDLGLEVELPSGPFARQWEGRIHLDWGPIPGSYAWVFPKEGTLTVGVIARKGQPEATRQYLKTFLEQQGLAGITPIRDSGHLTRSRTPTSPLGKNRVLLTGDAAGLLEPWTREGISFAVRSGKLAGSSIREAPPNDPGEVQRLYRLAVQSTLVPEMDAGEIFLRAYERRPKLIHNLMARNPLGWHEFCRVTRGETTIARALAHRPVRALVEAMAAG